MPMVRTSGLALVLITMSETDNLAREVTNQLTNKLTGGLTNKLTDESTDYLDDEFPDNSEEMTASSRQITIQEV